MKITGTQPNQESDLVLSAGSFLLRSIDALTLTVIIGIEALVATSTISGARVILALLFVLFVPGWAILRFWKLPALTERIALSIGTSIAVCSATSTFGLWLHIWKPIPLFNVLALASGVLVGINLLNDWRGSRS